VNAKTGGLRPRDFKSDIKPIWCPGCGHFAVFSALTKALTHLGLAREEVAVVSGIGCSSRLPAYLSTYGFHGVHGRALPVASGLKAARSQLTVVAVGGDGDGFSIGGNHFLHACRRNMNLTYVVMDNEVYGMTKGQASPTTAPDWTHSRLTPHGTGLPRFRPTAIAMASGAGFIARGWSGDPSGLTRLLVEAIRHPGFAFVHVLSPCRTFRPEQMAWKHQVHPVDVESYEDPMEAARAIHADDGRTLGIFHTASLPVWQPRGETGGDIPQIEQEFEA